MYRKLHFGTKTKVTRTHELGVTYALVKITQD